MDVVDIDGKVVSVDSRYSIPDLWMDWWKWSIALPVYVYNKMPWSGDVAQLIETWGQAMGVSQIGMINVSHANSGNPAVEMDIVHRYSYGRQLGRILDVLIPLVEQNAASLLESGKLGSRELEEFRRMSREIRQIKELNELRRES